MEQKESSNNRDDLAGLDSFLLPWRYIKYKYACCQFNVCLWFCCLFGVQDKQRKETGCMMMMG